MYSFIEACFARARTVILVFLVFVVAGIAAYQAIPKESDPDVAIPLIFVFTTLNGISPEDAERLIVRPLETELQSVEGLKRIEGTAAEGYGSVLLEFDAGFDSEQALLDVREKVDQAKAKLPADAEEPTVDEVNVALFPIITVTLSGPVSERAMLSAARSLQDRIEVVPGVLEVDIGGDREEQVEIVVDPMVMQTYRVSFQEVLAFVQSNNQLVAAGAIDNGAGRLVIKVPGLIEDLDDLLRMPVKVSDGTAVTFGDVASIRRTFMDPTGFARIDGQPAVTLEVKKRLGANIIETVDGVRAAVAEQQESWPEGIEVGFLQDESANVNVILADLVNNVLAAVLLVLLIMIAAMGLRSGLLVGAAAIPGSLLIGLVVLDAMGITMNIVVLFSLILVIGMLVDDSIVVSEYADRRMAEGMRPGPAYLAASKRMLWPIVGATATKIAVFAPLLFWPGVIGSFMQYLPITVIVMLTASLIVALVFLPVFGAIFGRPAELTDEFSETADLGRMRGLAGGYVRLLTGMVRRPVLTLAVAMAAMVGTFMAYGSLGRGVEFFPEIEPEFAQFQVRARGDLSVAEKDGLVRDVEARVLEMPEFETVYARTFAAPDRDLGEDVVGTIQVELTPWDERRRASEIFEDVRQRTADIPGIILQIQGAQEGPGDAKPINVELRSVSPEALPGAIEQIREAMDRIGGFVDVTDSRPLPGIEWRVDVDRVRAAEDGADIATIGSAIQMVTTGVLVADYRPSDADEEIDIRVRFPLEDRSLATLDRLRIQTDSGMMPMSNFVTTLPAPKTGVLSRAEGLRALSITSDVAEGVLADDQIRKLEAEIARLDLPDGVIVDFRGDQEDQQEAASFLMAAFGTAIALMVVILLLEFNSFYQVFLVMSSIVLSTAGVLIGLLVTAQPFGIVMCGIGIIALAGIVVNNNIILIDAYNDFRGRGLEPAEAAVRTGIQRLRPVFLTAFAMVLGLVPMVLQMTPDFFTREITFGAPSSQWWTQLSAAIAGGLAFATLLTLFLTPCMLVLGERVGAAIRRWRGRRSAELPAGAVPHPAE